MAAEEKLTHLGEGDIAAFHNSQAPKVRTQVVAFQTYFRPASDVLSRKRRTVQGKQTCPLGRTPPKREGIIMNSFLCLGSTDKLTSTWGKVSEGISQYWTVE